MATDAGPVLRARRLRHTAFKVRNLEVSVDFYTRILGMTVARRRESQDKNVMKNRRSAYLVYGRESDNEALELIQDVSPPDEFIPGNMYSHINISVPDLLELVEKLTAENVEFVQSPTPLAIGDRYHITFIRDPDGYEIELTDYP
jgi:lactoylglutathione lyase